MAEKEEVKKVGDYEQKIASDAEKTEVVAEDAAITEVLEVKEPATEEKAEKKEKVIIRKENQLTEDALATRKYAWLAYIFFFIPLLINKNSEFVRHHANEGLEVNIFDLIGTVLLICGVCIKTDVSAVKMFLIICTIIGLVLLMLTIITKIYMIIAACRGKKKETPWFWNIKIIK